LATTTAKTVPVTTNHHGASGGKVRAISQAVTMAEPSVKKSASDLPRSVSMTASAANAASVAMTSWTRMAGPTRLA
jgi:hypothetical protein